MAPLNSFTSRVKISLCLCILGSGLPIINPPSTSRTCIPLSGPASEIHSFGAAADLTGSDEVFCSELRRSDSSFSSPRFLSLFLICSVIGSRQKKGTGLTSSLMRKKERDEKRGLETEG